jgi:rod shape-determining protein MreC
MFTLRRWWDRHRLQVALLGAALGAAVLVRQTGAGFVFETYQLLTRPFQPNEMRERVLDNAQFQELQQRLTEMESQNQKLQELLGYMKQQRRAGIPAPVVGRSADHWWQQLVLGRGSNDGIKVGDVVMAPGGVIGRITNVTANTSRVLLLSDPSSRTGVAISRSRSMGYMRGQSGNRAIMEFFDKVPDVRRGDVVSTSAFSQLFPASVPVGRVESVNLSKSPAPEAIIELSSPVSYLEWAVIYPHTNGVQIGTPTKPGNFNAPLPGETPATDAAGVSGNAGGGNAGGSSSPSLNAQPLNVDGRSPVPSASPPTPPTANSAPGEVPAAGQPAETPAAEEPATAPVPATVDVAPAASPAP